jgi:hypothetical protein
MVDARDSNPISARLRRTLAMPKNPNQKTAPHGKIGEKLQRTL